EFTDRQDSEAHRVEEVRPLPLELKTAARGKPEEVRLNGARVQPGREGFAIDREPGPEPFLDGPGDADPAVELALAPKPGSPEPGRSSGAQGREPLANRLATREAGGGRLAGEESRLMPVAPGAQRVPGATPDAPIAAPGSAEPGLLSDERAKGSRQD